MTPTRVCSQTVPRIPDMLKTSVGRGLLGLAFALCVMAAMSVASTSVGVPCPTQCRCNFTPPSSRVVCPPPLRRVPGGLPSGIRALALLGTPSSQNAIPRLDAATLGQMSGLLELRLTFSGVVGLDSDAFRSTLGLKILDLRHNSLAVLATGTLAGLQNLEHLDLTGNKGCVLERGVFSGLFRLRTLLLGEVGVSVLPPDLFSDLRSLRILDLHGNGIRDVEAGVIAPLGSLQHLDLRHNALQMLSRDLETNLTGLGRLQLAGNLWRCNCEAKWLKSLPSLRPQTSSSRIHSSDLVVCSEPPKLRYRTLIRVPDREMTCMPPKVTSCDGPHVVTFGSQVTVTCTLSISDPEPEITWVSPDGRYVQNGTAYVTSRSGTTCVLVIEAAGKVDDGKWSVSAFNRHGMDNRSTEVHVVAPSTSSTTSKTTGFSAPAETSSRALAAPTGVERTTSVYDTGFYVAIGAFAVVGMATTVVFIAAACHARAKSRQKVVPDVKKINVREAGNFTFVLHVPIRTKNRLRV